MKRQIGQTVTIRKDLPGICASKLNGVLITRERKKIVGKSFKIETIEGDYFGLGGNLYVEEFMLTK